MSESSEPRFAANDRVRVKPGVTDFDYSDMPLGGCKGTVVEVNEGNCITCLVRWHAQTLESITPFYRERCEQDGVDFHEKWLDQEDLDADDDRPLQIEQSRGH